MPTLNGRIGVTLSMLLASALDVGSASYPVNYNADFQFTDGTGANQANRAFTDKRTLAASTTEDIDLAGVLIDALGNTLTFDKIKALIVKADAGNVNDVLVGGAASAQASAFFGDVTDAVRVKPGGVIALIAPDASGYDITATTADLLKIANSGAGSGVTYTIIIVGVV